MKISIKNLDELFMLLEEMEGINHLQDLVCGIIEEKYICGEKIEIIDRYVSGYLINRQTKTLSEIRKLINRSDFAVSDK